MKTERVVVGMSGGVDSSVAALLLKEQGYDVVGLFMLNWEETDANGSCPAESDYEDVRRVSSALGIPYYSVNFSRQYTEGVFSRFLDEYAAGRTPNPDVLCNREIKFGPFRDHAMALGADYIATGHFCGIDRAGGRVRLLKAADTEKDQTYFLNQVREGQLSNVIFPLSGMTKREVRAAAEKAHLPTARKKDSTGICFIGERNFRQFLSGYLPAREGDIKTSDGTTVGRHRGVMYYTLGQRKGLSLGGRSGGDGRWFVVGKDVKNNVLYVSHGDESPLYSSSCRVSELNWIGFEPPAEFDCTAKFRYRQPEQPVRVTLTDTGADVSFRSPQRAVTCGQYAVFYDSEACLGGGVIEDTAV